jgi:FkbM family methyltransferase
VKALLGSLQRRLSKSTTGLRFALRLRNQAECVIGYYLGESSDQSRNGEESLARCMASRCGSFVDVGANAGAWTNMWLKYAPVEARGLIFEPLPHLFKKLSREFAQQEGLSVVQAAVGDTDGELPFFADDNFDEVSSLVAKPNANSPASTMVPVCTLDSALEARRWETVDFLKIDAEGFDARVLQGARRLLEKKAIKALQFEYNSMWAGAGSTLTATLSYLRGLEYSAYLIRSDGLHEFDLETFGEYFRYSNFFAAPTTSMENLRNRTNGKLFAAKH